MRSLPRAGPACLPRAAGLPVAGVVSPATLRIVQEADATMSPDGWEADYFEPGFVDEAPPTNSIFSLTGAVPLV